MPEANEVIEDVCVTCGAANKNLRKCNFCKGLVCPYCFDGEHECDESEEDLEEDSDY